MKISEIPFEDENFKACVLETGFENAEDVKELRCRKRQIESLAGIEYFTELTLLDITRNRVSELDLSKNSKLEEAFLGNNELESLSVSGCAALNYLEAFINNLESVDLSNNPLLEEVYLEENDLESIDLSQNTALTQVRLKKNSLTDVKLPNEGALELLELEENPLTDGFQAQLAELSHITVRI